MMNFSNDSPVYAQIVDSIKRQIFGGQLDPGQRIASVRELAGEFGVNPNTMQKALAELERDGLVFTLRTAGRFITPDEHEIIRQRRNMLDAVIGRFLAEMRELGCSYDEVLGFISQNMQYPDSRPIVNADLDGDELYTGALPYGASRGRDELMSPPPFGDYIEVQESEITFEATD